MPPPQQAAQALARLEPHWLVILAAAETHGIPPAILAGIISRESRAGAALDSRGLGDGGHGHGVTQIDDRSFPQWCVAWRKTWAGYEHCAEAVTAAIQKGASVLASKLRYLRYRAAQACLLDSAPVAPDLLRAAVAAYNCGEGRVAKLIAQGRDVDSLTTGRDYSRDVLERARYYAAHGYPWPGEGGTDDAPTT